MAIEQAAAAAQQQKITPAQRAAMFASMTRQHLQMEPSKTGIENDSLKFTLTKSRLLSRVRLLVEATVKVAHATLTTYTPPAFSPFTLLRHISLDMNNGFSPFSVSGKGAYMYNLLRANSEILQRAATGRGMVKQGLVASLAGTDNAVQFIVDLPTQLNERDAIGLILLQNEQTVVEVTVDIGLVSAIVESGYTATLTGQVKVTPMIETFSIPANKNAFPDISVLKLVNTEVHDITSVGSTRTIKLPVGQTYRKIAFYAEDALGLGFSDNEFSGNIRLSFNQADTPYRVAPAFLSAINSQHYTQPLPEGMYAFDFSYQGVANYGGARDYIDTERLTEFWLEFDPTQLGQVTVLYETLSRLRG